jgi:antitoxin (DNA-binding transcriptional repressor) of toxin-antitoxin stability system
VKVVGVKALKNSLSRYLDLVRQREVVQVTDRDEVIAELRLPSQPVLTRASPWVTFLEEQARRDTVRLARRRRSRLDQIESLTKADVAAMLQETRAERH